MRRPLDWIVVGISLCFLVAGSKLSGRARTHSRVEPVTVVQSDGDGVASQMRIAPELESLLEGARFELARSRGMVELEALPLRDYRVEAGRIIPQRRPL